MQAASDASDLLTYIEEAFTNPTSITYEPSNFLNELRKWKQQLSSPLLFPVFF